MIYIGIDPGQKGYIVVIGDDNKPYLQPMPILNGEVDEADLKQFLETEKDYTPFVTIEKQLIFPGQAKTNFVIGLQYGQIRGICAGLGIGYIVVHPSTWKSVILKGLNWKDNKDVSIQYVKQKYPDIELRASVRCKKDNDNMADAICLAEYGRMVSR